MNLLRCACGRMLVGKPVSPFTKDEPVGATRTHEVTCAVCGATYRIVVEKLM